MIISKHIVTLLFLLSANYCFATTVSDTIEIKSHLTAVTQTQRFRTYKNIDQLNKTADYIHSVFGRYADSVYFQEYSVNGHVYKNVICSFGTENLERIIVGAHYDVCDNQQGADDNASGIVGLFRTFTAFKRTKIKSTN